MTNNLPYTNALLNKVGKMAVGVGLFVLCAGSFGCAVNSANLNTIPSNGMGIETQAIKIDLNDVNSFFNADTGYSEKFTPEEHAERQKGWELLIKNNPKEAKAIRDFVVDKNEGKKIPEYKNFPKEISCGGFLGFVNFLLKGANTCTLAAEELGSGYYFKSDIKEFHKYMAGNGVGLISYNTKQINNTYYPVKDKNPLLDASWDKLTICMTSVHEKLHNGERIRGLGSSPENEESNVIAETNKSRVDIGKPLREENHLSIMVEERNPDYKNIKDDPSFDKEKYKYVKCLIEKNMSLSFPEKRPPTKDEIQLSNIIENHVNTIHMEETLHGKSPQISLEKLQADIEADFKAKQANQPNP